MYLVAIGWIYVVLMMAIAEAMSSQGTLLGAVVTFVLYGVMPLAIVLYILGTPARKRALRAADRRGTADAVASDASDGGRHAARDGIAAEREEP